MPKNSQPTKVVKSWSEESNKKKKSIKPFYIMVIILLLITNLFTGYITYGVVVAWCMKLPVTASGFSTSRSYFVPGQTGYGPNALRHYYCTEQDAINAGFYKSSWR